MTGPRINKIIQSLLFLLLLALLSGCSSSRPDRQLRLQSLGPAPELENQVWINSDQALRLAQLRGKVVLLEMWTYG